MELSKSVMVAIGTLGFAFSANVYASNDKEPYTQETLRADLAKPFITTSLDGEPTAFFVQMKNGKAAEITPVAPPRSPNLTIDLVERKDDSTIVKVWSSLPGKIKYDLHISGDDETYVYTSSCPLTEDGGTYEHWPLEITWFAISNIRQVEDDQSTCE